MPDTIWSPDLSFGKGPKYLILAKALRDDIQNGTLVPGFKLPPVRELAWDLKLTPGTVARAYQLATQEGLLSATVGRGTFVAQTRMRIGPTQSMFQDPMPSSMGEFLDLRAPKVGDVGQLDVFRESLQLMASQLDESWLHYTSQYGETELRETIAPWLGDRPLGPVDPNDLALTHGGQNALGLIFDCCLRGERPAVAIEELSYPGFRYGARAARAEVIAVELDQYGMIPEALEAACKRYNIQVVCLTPDGQNPTTVHMPLERRLKIAEIARHYGLYVIEDGCFSGAVRHVPSLRALAPERVWVVGSFAKTISAALRFGYVICPSEYGETGRLSAQHAFFALSKPVSEMCLHLFRTGQAVTIREKVQAKFAQRLQIMVNSLGRFDLRWQDGLPFTWLHLPTGWRASSLSRMAQQECILFRSADEFSLISGRAPNAIRLSLGGGESVEQFQDGLLRLAKLLDQPIGELAV